MATLSSLSRLAMVALMTATFAFLPVANLNSMAMARDSKAVADRTTRSGQVLLPSLQARGSDFECYCGTL